MSVEHSDQTPLSNTPEVDASNFGNPPVAPPVVPKNNRNPLALVVVAVIAAAMLYVGFHMARRSGPDAPPILGKTTPAPDFTLEKLDGGSMKLSDLRGKAVVLNFWATWCGPCKIETPWLVDLQNQYGPRGFQIIGISTEGDDLKPDDKEGWSHDKAAIAKFVKQEHMQYPVLINGDSLATEYGGLDA